VSPPRIVVAGTFNPCLAVKSAAVPKKPVATLRSRRVVGNGPGLDERAARALVDDEAFGVAPEQNRLCSEGRSGNSRIHRLAIRVSKFCKIACVGRIDELPEPHLNITILQALALRSEVCGEGWNSKLLTVYWYQHWGHRASMASASQDF